MGNTNSLIDGRNKFITSTTVDDFKRIEDQLTWCDKYNSGKLYRVWRATCLYTFMTEKRTDLQSPEVICDFLDLEQEVIDAFQQRKEWAIYPMFAMARITEKAKYQKIIDEVKDINFKSKVDSILIDDII